MLPGESNIFTASFPSEECNVKNKLSILVVSAIPGYTLVRDRTSREPLCLLNGEIVHLILLLGLTALFLFPRIDNGIDYMQASPTE